MDRNKIIEFINNNDSEGLNDYLQSQNSFDNSFKIQLKFENKSTNPNPEYTKLGDSGFDFRANLSTPITIQPLHRTIIPTGLFFEIPIGMEIQVRPRSGLAVKNGITVLNTPGTVDSNFRGEVKVILVNLGQEPFTISHGDRIAQGVYGSVFAKHNVDLKQVEEINHNTERGSNGFGSSGLK